MRITNYPILPSYIHYLYTIFTNETSYSCNRGYEQIVRKNTITTCNNVQRKVLYKIRETGKRTPAYVLA